MKQALSALVFILTVSVVLGGVAGTWAFNAKSSSGEIYDLTLVLKEVDGTITGELGNYEGSIPLEKAKLEGSKLTFDVTTPEGITYSADLTVEGETMEGSYKGTDGTTGTITAKKQ